MIEYYLGDNMESKYVKIFNDIVGKIQDGTYLAGTKIASEFELMDEYNVSRDTIRKALAMLEKQGYIQKIKGKGSFVLDIQKYNFSVTGIHTFKEVAGNLGKVHKTIVDSLELINPKEGTKIKLNLDEEDKIWRVIRIREIDGERIILDKDYLVANYIKNISKEVCEKSLYEYIEGTLGLKIAYAKKEITVQMATDSDRELLDMKNYDMIVVVKSYTYLDDTSLFQYTESRHRPDKFNFVHFARRNTI